jgi:hypothetical protein
MVYSHFLCKYDLDLNSGILYNPEDLYALPCLVIVGLNLCCATMMNEQYKWSIYMLVLVFQGSSICWK